MGWKWAWWRRGNHWFWWQPKLAPVETACESTSCVLRAASVTSLLLVGLNDKTHLTARPNELFIAWLTGSGFSVSLGGSLNRELQTSTQMSSLRCHQTALPRWMRLDRVFPIQDILKQTTVTPFRAHNSAPIFSGKGACENECFGLGWQIF